MTTSSRGTDWGKIRKDGMFINSLPLFFPSSPDQLNCIFFLFAVMYLLAILLPSLLAHPFLTSCKAVPPSLKDCAMQALRGSDAAQRIVTPQDETYTDARLGEKIQ